jgi:NTP pyrophosphatase (non-canonical NTP hydrolase)
MQGYLNETGMTFDAYQQKTLATATDEGSELLQRVLGLVGEAGEITDKIKRWYRDDNADFSRLNKEVLAAELGDTLWYVAALADLFGYRLSEIASTNIKIRADRIARRKSGGTGGVQ